MTKCQDPAQVSAVRIILIRLVALEEACESIVVAPPVV